MKTEKQQQAEFERISNAPSPNPRYAGLSVIEATRRLLRTVPKKAERKVSA
jgi:hypothetical protein